MREPRLITYDFGSDFIGKIADSLYRDFYKKNKSLDRVACVFGGRRPALFLKKRLSEKIKTPFLPPALFSLDEFMEYIASPGRPLAKISDLENYYLLYRLSCRKLDFLKNKKPEFSEFLSWAKELASFIDQLDLENISSASLAVVEKSAAIGYEVPENINRLLQKIIEIRSDYHVFLRRQNLYSRGRIYLEAAKKAKKKSFIDFDAFFFCGLHFISQNARKVLGAFSESGKGFFLFEGSAKRWPSLKRNFSLFNRPPLVCSRPKSAVARLEFYQGFDVQSQVSLVKEVLKGISEKDNTLILLPEPDSLLPLLSEVGSDLKEFNVSLGYPLSRSSFYDLFIYLFDAHKNRQKRKYYSQDYLKILKHPLVKNIALKKNIFVTRVLTHKIEEAFCGVFNSSVSGNLFVSLSGLEGDRDIYNQCRKSLDSLGFDLTFSLYRQTVKKIHNLFFRNWHKVNNLKTFSRRLKLLLDFLSARQPLLWHFPLEPRALDVFYRIKDELASLTFSGQDFGLSQIWHIFKERLDSARISFQGSPLKGAQILGLFETRSLEFKNVIVLDANEGVLPRLKMTEPLIPSEIMLGLGLDNLAKEEEIQRYNFMRLIESAEKVFLIWAKNQTQEKSRFIESIIWQRQKKIRKVVPESIPQAAFSFSFRSWQKMAVKTEAVIEFLRNSSYSASRINTYLECPLQFYYKYVLGLKERENLLEGVRDSQIGNFVHQLLYRAYGKFLGKKPNFDSKFKAYLKEIFNAEYESQLKPRMRSDHFLLKGIIEARLDKFLDQEKKRESEIEKIEALEREYHGFLNLDGLTLKIKYIVDRIDLCRQNQLLVIDYKTGGRDVIPRRLNRLEKMGWDRRQIKEAVRSFQLPIYSYFIEEKFKGKNVNACIYNLRTAEKKFFILPADYQEKEKVLDCCLKALKFILGQILDPKVPFQADKDSRRCKYCPYRNLCG